MTRKQKRRAVLVGIFVTSAFFIWIGFDGYVIDSCPAQFVGYLVGALGIAGLLGLNIHHGGPLDPRNDPKDELSTKEK